MSSVSQPPARKSIKEISPIDAYRLLPRTNCRECGEANCMAFATRLVNGEYRVTDCPPIRTQEFHGLYLELCDLLHPPVKAVTIGTGAQAITIGGKHVVYRHDFTYHNPTAIAIDVTDSMLHEDLVKRVKAIESFSYEYIGRTLALDAIAIRSTSGDPNSFAAAVGTVAGNSNYPLILCTHDPIVMAAGVKRVKERRPLLYAAIEKNW